MSITENTSNSNIVISQAEINELDNFLASLLNDLDEKVAVLQSQSPPRSNNISSQDMDSEICRSIIKYSTVQDDGDPDITNVVAYEDVKTSDQLPAVSNYIDNFVTKTHSLLDDISSINSSDTIFSPAEPNSHSVQSSALDGTIKSINSISSIDTIIRPPLLTSCQDNESVLTSEVLVNPFSKLDGIPFHLFTVSQLDASTTGYLQLGSRSVAYYGEHPYSYGSVSHSPRPYSDNSYLLHILSYVQIVIPNVKFNSAMIHKYSDGNSVIPKHSDDEECIENGSDIITISFGDTRVMEFQNKQSGHIENVSMSHGEVLIMSKASQNYFTHAIPFASNKSIRLSVTLRQIIPSSKNTAEIDLVSHDVNNSQSTITDFLYNLDDKTDTNNKLDMFYAKHACQPFLESNDGYQVEPNQISGSSAHHLHRPSHHNMTKPLPKMFQTPVEKPILSQIRQRSQYSWQREGWQPPQKAPVQKSWKTPTFPPQEMHPSRNMSQQRSSEFKPLKSYSRQEDIVFISSSMFADLDAGKLSSKQVKAHVFYYRGADSHRMAENLRNDKMVQNLAAKGTVSKVFLLTGTNNVDSVCHQRQSLHDSCQSISKTIEYVQSLFSAAIVNVINILPRVMENRKNVINQFNHHIESFCERHHSNQKLRYIDTNNIRLFTLPNGTRKSELFKYVFRNDFDNVHLNNYGIIKLGKHLKYLSHCK